MRKELASDAVIDEAYRWLSKQRRPWPANADVWWLRSQWSTLKPHLQQQLLAGSYRFEPLSRVTKANGNIIHLWSAQDALVLKALAIVLAEVLPVSTRCTHVKDHGGAKAAVRAVRDQLCEHTFVMRTDVKSYYERIDHHQMLDRLEPHVKDRSILNLLWQVMRRTVTWGGLYRDCEQGISRGCPLSPLLGAFYLSELDMAMETSGLFYRRFMDDIVVMAPTRHKLRAGIRTVNQHFQRLGLRQHPDKTFIGRIDKGFDFLGYHFSRVGMRIASAALDKFLAQATRLYEQERHQPTDALGCYVRRWLGWAGGGLSDKQKPRHGAGLIDDLLPIDLLLSSLSASPTHTR